MSKNTDATGTLTTLGWTYFNDKKVCKELTVPMKNVLFIQEHDGGKGDTTFLFISTSGAIHVDIPFKQMKKILKEHLKDPDKDFNTHPDLEDESPKTKPGSDRHGKK